MPKISPIHPLEGSELDNGYQEHRKFPKNNCWAHRSEIWHVTRHSLGKNNLQISAKYIQWLWSYEDNKVEH